LGCVFDQLELSLFCDMGEGGPISSLAEEVDGEDGADFRAAWTIEDGCDGGGIEVEGGGFDVGKEWDGSGAENGTDRGEEAEGCGEDGHFGADAGGGKGEPEGVSARRAADGMSDSELRGGGSLEGRNRLSQNELLLLQYVADGLHKLLMEGLILAFQVQHRNWLGGCGSALRWIWLGFHSSMLPACWIVNSQNREDRLLLSLLQRAGI
jgi:hypothetical protein